MSDDERGSESDDERSSESANERAPDPDRDRDRDDADAEALCDAVKLGLGVINALGQVTKHDVRLTTYALAAAVAYMIDMVDVPRERFDEALDEYLQTAGEVYARVSATTPHGIS